VKLWPALTADVACVLVFATVGRSSHGESTDLTGVLQTAWPFLTGYVLGLLLVRGWQHPLRRLTGVALWVGTVVGGMMLRAVTGAGTQPSFVMVAAVVLGVMLLGWRGVLALVQVARSRAGGGATSTR